MVTGWTFQEWGASAEVWRWEGLSALDAGEAEAQWAGGDELNEVRGVGTG